MINNKKNEQSYFITADGIKIPLTKNWVQTDENTMRNQLDGSVFIFCRMNLRSKIRTSDPRVIDLLKSITKYGGFFISRDHAAVEDGRIVFKESSNIISLDKNTINRLMNYYSKKENNLESVIAYSTGSRKIKIMTPIKMLYDYIKYNHKVLKRLRNPMVEISFEFEPVKLADTYNTGIRGVLIIK